MAVIRCPSCGKPNPDFLEVCQYCETKLHPEGVTPPPPPPTAITGPISADDTLIRNPAAAPTAGPAALPEPDDEPLDWISRLRRQQAGEVPPAAAAAADEPDWMWTGATGDQDTAAPAASPAAPDSELPEWLRDLDEPIDLTPPAPSKPPAPATTTATPPATAAASVKAPATAATPPVAPAAVPPLAPSTPAQPAAPAAPSPLPSLTAAAAPEPSPFEPTASDVTIPPRPRRKMTDWLNKLNDMPPAAAQPAAAPPSPATTNTDADLPDWLKAVAAEAQSSGDATPAIEAATQPPDPTKAQPTPEADLPDWLRALRSQAQPPAPVPGTGALQNQPVAGTDALPAARRLQELPDSLRSQASDDTLIPRPGARPLEAGADDMPAWLKGILTTHAQDAAPADQAVTPAPATGAVETPTAAPAAPAMTPAAALPPAAAPASPAPSAPPPASDGTVPPPARPGKRLTDWLGNVPAPAADVQAPADELPDWLKALSAESASAAAASAAPAEATPDWLRAATPSAAPASPAPTVSTPPAGAAPAEPTVAAATPAAELPDWLKAMAPAGVTPAAAAAPAEPAAEAPDWFQELAPAETAATLAATTAAAAPPAPVPEPAAPVVPAHEPAAPADELPDWLAALASAPPPPAVPPVPAPTAVDQAPTAAPVAPPAVTTPAAAPTPAEELPDWLKAIAPAATAASAAAATPAEAPAAAPMVAPPVATTTPAPTPAEELPDWLKALASATPAVATTAATAAPAEAPAPAPVAPPAAATTPVAAPAEELPDWFKAIAPAPATEAVTTPGEELPDWLKAISEASTTAATAATTAAAAEAMAGTTAPTEAPEAAATAEVAPTVSTSAAPAEAETTLVPGVANTATTAAPETAGAAEPAAADTTLPPWLVGVGTGPLPDLPELDEETMAWLAEAQKAEAEPEPAGLDLKSAKLPAEKPEWLDELAAASTAAPATAAATEIAPTPEDELPGWLKAMRGQTAEEELQPEAMPDWLRALRGLPPGVAAPIPTDRPTVAATATAAATTAAALAGQPAEAAAKTEAATAAEPSAAAAPAGLEQGALPAWLAAMRPIDIQQPAPTEADNYEETLGVLAGMRGVLRAEPVVALPRKAAAQMHTLAISDAQRANMSLLAELLRPEAALLPARRGRVRLSALAERWAVFAVLLVALVLTQFQAQLQLPAIFAPPAATLPPEAAAVYHLIETLPPGKPALIAFDYEAAQRGELDPGAQTVMAHLVRHGTPVVAVSLRLTGASVAQAVLLQQFAEVDHPSTVDFPYGNQYLNLGFIPGGPVGLLQFAADPRSMFTGDYTGVYSNTAVWSTPILASVHSLSDFGLIVLVSGAPESTRAWVEQAQHFAGDVPTVAVISASAEPMVRPYYDDPSANSLISGQLPLKGLIVGLGGAAAYERATYSPGAATALWPALGGGLLAAAMIIGVGNLFFLVAGALRRRKV